MIGKLTGIPYAYSFIFSTFLIGPLYIHFPRKEYVFSFQGLTSIEAEMKPYISQCFLFLSRSKCNVEIKLIV
jgi:hypothetical protein